MGGSEDRQDEGAEAGGPVPVRDLMKQMTPEAELPEVEGEPRWDGMERGFERDGEAWVVRTAGAGMYGTGRKGTARLMALHFCREAEADTPVREALVPAAVVPHLRADELRVLFERATPIDATEAGRS